MKNQAQLYSENLGFPLVGVGGENPSQDWMESAYGFNDLSYVDLQQPQQQYHQLQHYQQNFQQQVNQYLHCENNFLIGKNKVNSNEQTMQIISQMIEVEIEKEKQDIDRFISLHNQRLRLALQVHKQHQLITILKMYESNLQILLRKKDEEMKNVMSKSMELENFLRSLEIERQTWQMVAKENEVATNNLNSKIEKLRENCCFQMNGRVEDAESCCQMGENKERRRIICKSCFSANSCVVFLPCRHISSCKSCDAFLDSCPICRIIKESSIEVLF